MKHESSKQSKQNQRENHGQTGIFFEMQDPQFIFKNRFIFLK